MTVLDRLKLELANKEYFSEEEYKHLSYIKCLRDIESRIYIGSNSC